ncbi:hypothetical protein OBBRIDRAFT_829289 [Obba rivulosa]|uniref:Ras modification protein ERF4 n=1 Tax=Obba rivulosa TaxID=1052685 RepID=A0A8E2AMX6_9APHY|nr:hypothetical protein OBBRIDRAFT_829289 [Obba rivulosa]
MSLQHTPSWSSQGGTHTSDFDTAREDSTVPPSAVTPTDPHADASAPPRMATLGLRAAPPDLDTSGTPLAVSPASDGFTYTVSSNMTPTTEEQRRRAVEDEEEGPEMDITHARRSWDAGSATSRASSRRDHARSHPLDGREGENVDMSSPTPWDRMEPPRPGRYGAGSHRVHEFGKAGPSRPLVPHSSYYFAPPPPDSAYGTDPIGQIGVHHPREIVRIERDYTGGELPQFAPVYPLELEGRITPTQFLETINAINEQLISACSLSHSLLDNALAFFSLQISRAVKKSHYEKEMDRLHQIIDDFNVKLYNPAGLNILWPRKVAFMFLEIEYY